MIPGEGSPLGADGFVWADFSEGDSYSLSPSEERATGATGRPSESRPRGLDGGRPTSLGVDRRSPERREEDILAHRARVDAHRALGDMTTEEALDSPTDWT